ncbi:MAG: gamma-glutamyltransferase family protein [Streptosporangiaceae bacterium]
MSDAGPVATGSGGAVATVDRDATEAGISVLREGGNAVDAAVAAAATLGVTEPYAMGVGGGSFLLYHEAVSGRVYAVDGRSAAPAALPEDVFDGLTRDEATTGGRAVGVPGTPRLWERVLDWWGRRSLSRALEPAIEVAERGFVVDREFREQTRFCAQRLAGVPASAALFLTRGEAPAIGRRFQNPHLADTYRLLACEGADALYQGALAREIVRAVREARRPGFLSEGDLSRYDVVRREPVHVAYRGVDVYGMGPPSLGGSTVGRVLRGLAEADGSDETGALHGFLTACRAAFADRARTSYEGDSTSNLVTADGHGNVVAHTLTIERTGGSAVTVPGRGFLLGNELTDFVRPRPGRRPRSDMSPTIVLRDGRPLLALGAAGGATIITTVAQILFGRVALGLDLPGALAAPRVSQRDGATAEAEPAFMDRPERGALERLGRRFVLPKTTYGPEPELSAATALEVLDDGQVQAVAEPVRRGGGAAAAHDRP